MLVNFGIMELAASIVPWISPSGAFIPLANCKIYTELKAESEMLEENCNMSQELWRISAINPANRINSLSSADNRGWRIDGCCLRGTQFFAIPTQLSRVIPLRVDVYIPDQGKQPIVLRRTLRSGAAFYIQDPSVNHLGITQLIVAVLEKWSTSINMSEMFNALPFGSRIVIENIVSSINDIRVRILPNFALENQLLSIHELNALWDHHLQFPLAIELQKLELVSQLHDTISLVRIPDVYGQKLCIFKSTTHQYRYIYHELKLLLAMPAHRNIMTTPLNVVVSKTFREEQTKVYGFILEYHSGGNLANALATRAKHKTLYLRDQLRWARQIVSALIFICNGPARYYSELKPDNILLKSGCNDVLLIDFEQHANWETFSAPEIYHVENLEKILQAEVLPSNKQKIYEEYLLRHTEKCLPAKDIGKYENPQTGYFRAWNALESPQQETAMVYALGKVLWCIFEGCSHTVNSLKEEYIESQPIEFPKFQDTPLNLQGLIKLCTNGAPEWKKGRTGIMRVGDIFYRKENVEQATYHLSTAAESMAAAKAMSEEYIREMEEYLDAKQRWMDGVANQEDMDLLGFLKRPLLEDVLEAIVAEEKLLSSRS